MVTTDLFKATIDSEGGTVNHLELLKFDEADRTQRVVLFENGSPAKRYVAQTGLLNPVAGDAFPNHLTAMTPKAGPRRDGRRPGHARSELRKRPGWRPEVHQDLRVQA